MLTSLQNPLVKQIRKLHQSKERHQQNQFLLEGTNLVEAACQANLPLLTVCHTQAWQERYPTLWQQVTHAALRVEVVSPDVLKAIATTVAPDGVIAIVARTVMVPPQITTLGVVLETVQDPGNLGTIIRTSAAVGADGLLISADGVDPAHPKVLRASAGQWFQVPMVVSSDLITDVAGYRQQGMQVIATLPAAKLTYWDVDLCRPTLIVMGNEGAGLSPALAALADTAVTIPLEPEVESLNVAIATALILYEAKRQRRAAGNR